MGTRFVEVLGLRVRVLEAGNGAGAPVLLVHGVGGWAENWQEALAPITATGRRAIAVDLPGFGESERPRGARYFDPRRPFYANFIAALIDALGVGPAHLVGNSLGGAVAFMAAVHDAARVRSLSLVAAGGIGREVASTLRVLTVPGLGLLAKLPRRPESADNVLRSCFWDRSRIPAHLYAEARTYGNASLDEFIRVIRAGLDLRGVRPSLRRDWLARAGSFAGPVLVVWGREDAVIPVSHARRITDIFPRAEVQIIEGCGHVPMAERPVEFLAALLPFLARSDAQAVQ